MRNKMRNIPLSKKIGDGYRLGFGILYEDTP